MIQSVRQTFAGEARAPIAADAIVSSNRPVTPEVRTTIGERLTASGAEAVGAVEMATMVRAAEHEGGLTRMVELKGVEAGFPYFGRLALAGGQPYTHAMIERFGALIRPELQAQLGVRVGDGLLIGTKRFEIRGIIETEPGRRLGAFSLGPRVLVSLADLQETGLLGFGSRATYQLLVEVPDATLDPLVA